MAATSDDVYQALTGNKDTMDSIVFASERSTEPGEFGPKKKIKVLAAPAKQYSANRRTSDRGIRANIQNKAMDWAVSSTKPAFPNNQLTVTTLQVYYDMQDTEQYSNQTPFA